MQPQSQNIYVPQSAANNSTGRTNQRAAGNIYRQNPTSAAPRNSYVHPAVYPAVHPSVVLGQFTTPYATRTPQLQQCQYPAQFYPHMYYPYYLPSQQQRAAVNPGVGVGISSAMSGGSDSGPQGQIPLSVAPVSSTVLGVANTTAAQPVRVASLVGMPHQPPQQQTQNPPPTKGKLRSHALKIIHPITNRNILDDLDIDKNDSTNLITGGLPIATTSSSSTSVANIVDSPLDIENCSSTTSVKVEEKLSECPKTHTEILQHIEMSSHQTAERTFKDATQQQTPIVSAMMDAPSVEIPPTQPQKKERTKKSQNVSVVKQDENVYHGKTEDNIKHVTDASTTSTANSTCVQESLSSSYINQQVPQQEELKGNISSKSQSFIKLSGDNTITKEKESRKSNDYFGASGEEKSDICSITESVKTMEVKENLTLPQHKPINIVNFNEPQKQEQNQLYQQQETSHSNATNSNNVTAATFTKSTDKLINNYDLINNNNDSKKSSEENKANVFPTNTTTIKNDDKLDKKNDNIIEKTEVIAKVAVATEIKESCTSSSKETSSNDKTSEESDRVNISPKEEIQNTGYSLAKSISDSPSTISTNKEKPNPETGCDRDDNTESAENKEEVTRRDEVPSNNMPFKSLTNYNDGQSNPNGKKKYTRSELMQIRYAKPTSEVNTPPKISGAFSCLPSFANRCNKKVQSMGGAFGGARGSSSGESKNYMKDSSMSGRGGADSGHHNRNSGKPIIHLNLSLNQDVKLNEADNAWRPRVLVKSADTYVDAEQKAQREKEELIRRVRGILNKLTPEKFEPLVEEIIKLKIDTMDKMEAVMILVFEKAIDEPNFSVSYASLCHRLISEVKARDERMESGTKTNLASFRSALLDKTEREFNHNVTKTNAKEEKLKPIREKINNCTDPNEKVDLEALLDEEERKIRRRSGGTVRFIGELFKISILTGRIIFTCIEALLKDPNNEDMLECLCKLLTTVGQKFELTKTGKDDKSRYSLDSVIYRMQNIASKNENSKISSRVRFMLKDVIDLREKKWQSTRNEAPKTMEEIEKEANNEHLNNPYHYMSSMSGGGISGKRDDRGGRIDGRNYGGSHSQRGDTGSLKRQQGGIGGGSHSQSGNSNNDDTWHLKTGKGNRSLFVDSSKLFGMAVDMNNKKMGGAALFQWNSPQQPTSTPNSFAALSLDSNRSDRDRDRDRSGPRNKGSYNKGSTERDRYDHDRLLSRTGSTQVSRENSSSRARGMGSGRESSSNMQKSSSHSKYQQTMPSSSLSRMTSSKMSSMTSSGGSSSTGGSGFYRDSHNFNPTANESGPDLSPPPAVFEEPSDSDLKLIKSVVTEMVESAVGDATASCIEKIKDNQLCGLLYYILTNYLHLANVGPTTRRHLANVVVYLIEKKYISVEHFRLAYNSFAELASDLIFDIPELWLYILELTGPLFVKKLITVNDLWNSKLRASGPPSFSLKFLKTFLKYCTEEVGPSFTRNMWKKYELRWTSFMNENDVAEFIKTNKFEYVENEDILPDIDSKESKEKRNKRVVEHIEHLLKEGAKADDVIDYINGNISQVDKIFVRSLTTTLTSFAINDSNNYSLNVPCFQTICVPVLLRYLDSKEDLELECLYAITLLVHTLEHPRALLGSIFAELNDADVIPHDTFIAWRDSKEQSAGKGVAVKALNPFFNQVINGETSDDN